MFPQMMVKRHVLGIVDTIEVVRDSQEVNRRAPGNQRPGTPALLS
jgi:hypothetical protein